MISVNFRLISAACKCFEDAPVDSFARFSGGTSLQNDLFAFGAALSAAESAKFALHMDSELAPYITVYRVESVAVALPTYAFNTDSDYLHDKQPGRYPDLMRPLAAGELFPLTAGKTASFRFEINVPENAAAGVYPINVALSDASGARIAEEMLRLEIFPAVLPEQKLIYTEWFHCDCLATYYNVEPLSEEHWRIIENFAATAVKNGVNMLLMPVFTPPLDTAVGGERPTVQLVGVTKKSAGDYAFDFSLVDRWLAMCERIGVRYHEISHLFTQWGAEHAPKIMATVDGVYTKLFGWETDSLSEEYLSFLRQFLAALKAYLRGKGLLDKTMFHISDEPSREHLERYRKLREALDESFDGCICADALSSYDFYADGAVAHPIVATDHIEPFLQNRVPNLWCYYCCSQHEKVSNRFIAMSMNRARVIGTQLFKFRLEGFLHWGYNFYYSQYSTHPIDPYVCNDGGWVPAGDAFSVYPAPDGTAYPSLHLMGFTEALHDLRAFELLASLTSHAAVVTLIEAVAGMPLTFSEYPRDDTFAERVREAVNREIDKAAGALNHK